MAQSLRTVEIYPITVRELEVLRVSDVTGGMRRITLGGAGLKSHTAPNGMPVNAFRSDGFDDEFKLFFTHPSLEQPLRPEQGDGHVNWPRDERLISRTYTARGWDPEAGEHGELDVDFVVHGLGVATTWARRAEAGQRIPIAGPKSSGTHPQGADWSLVAGDETALPAIGRWLEQWPPGARGQVFIEVAEHGHRQELPVPEGVELTWLSRNGAEPGSTTLLFDAVRDAAWWDGTVFAWVAGEALSLVPIRRWLKNERRLDREQMEVTGYWRRQTTQASTEDPAVPGDAHSGREASQALHEMAEILPGFALRTAVTLGLPEAFEGLARTAVELAETVGAPAVGVNKLLRYLAALHVVEAVDTVGAAGVPAGPEPVPDAGEAGPRYRLTAVGRELEDEHLRERLDLEGYPAHAEIAAGLALLESVRGSDTPRTRFRQDLQSRIALLRSRLEEAEEMAGYYGATLVGMLPLSGAAGADPGNGADGQTGADHGTGAVAGDVPVAVASPAAGELAETLVRADPRIRVTVVANPAELEAISRLHPAHERIRHEPGTLLNPLPGRHRVILLTGMLAEHPDADARHILTCAAAALTEDGAVCLFEEVLDPAETDEHELEHDLVGFALTGGGARTDAELRALAWAAGLRSAEPRNVGWGGKLYVLRPGRRA